MDIPHGLEVLVKKAAVDAAFRDCLLRERDGAADHIGLVLEPAEAVMLRAIPAAQLEAVVAGTTVPPRFRAAFMGYAAAAMLAALGLGTEGCVHGSAAAGGARADYPPPGTGSGDVYAPTAKSIGTAAATAAGTASASGKAAGPGDADINLDMIYTPRNDIRVHVRGGIRPDIPIAAAPEIVAPDDAGVIAGHVVNKAGNGLAGVRVEVEGREDLAATTDKEGLYQLGPLPPGVYKVTCSAPHMVSEYRLNIKAQAGSVTVIDFQMYYYER